MSWTHFINMDFIFRHKVLEVMFSANSSKEEQLAKPQIRVAVTFTPKARYSKGKQNSMAPVALLAYVCKKAKV